MISIILNADDEKSMTLVRTRRVVKVMAIVLMGRGIMTAPIMLIMTSMMTMMMMMMMMAMTLKTIQ